MERNANGGEGEEKSWHETYSLEQTVGPSFCCNRALLVLLRPSVLLALFPWALCWLVFAKHCMAEVMKAGRLSARTAMAPRKPQVRRPETESLLATLGIIMPSTCYWLRAQFFTLKGRGWTSKCSALPHPCGKQSQELCFHKIFSVVLLLLLLNTCQMPHISRAAIHCHLL